MKDIGIMGKGSACMADKVRTPLDKGYGDGIGGDSLSSREGIGKIGQAFGSTKDIQSGTGRDIGRVPVGGSAMVESKEHDSK